MADIKGLQGLSTSDGTQKIIVGYGNDFHVWDPILDKWNGASVPISRNTRIRSTAFLDKAFFVNGYRIISAGNLEVGDDMKRFDGTNWFNENLTKKVPLANYVHQLKDRLYLGDLYFRDTNQVHPSKVWFSDLSLNNDIKYGFEEGTVLNGTKGNNWVYVPTGNRIFFKTRNIKVGDPLTITGSDLSRNVYYVAEVKSETILVLTENLEDDISNKSFWVGSNFLDVSTNNNEVVTGLGDNNDRLLIFKNDSLFRFDNVALRKIKGVPGTVSQDSVVNIKEFTYYFHRTGVWRTDGISAELVSRPVQKWIDAISSDIYTKVVGWQANDSRETYRLYVGDLNSIDDDILITNAFLDFDTATETWSIGKLPFRVTASTEFIENNNKNIYLGTDIDQVHQSDFGLNDNGVAIPFSMDTGFHFPAGPTMEIEIEKILVYAQEGRGAQIRFKMFGTPFTVDRDWNPLDDVGEDITEIKLEARSEVDNKGRGVAFQVASSSIDRGPIVERIDVFWKPVTQRSL